MIDRLLFLLFFVSTTFSVHAQKTQWADKVLKVSSEYIYEKAPGQYLAAEALGKPTALPAFGASPTAYCPAKEVGTENEILRLGYATPMHVAQIAIAENFNPGSLTKLYLLDTLGNPHLVYENPTPGPLEVKGRMFNLFIDPTSYLVAGVELHLATAAVPGFNQVDAVGISDSQDSIRASINLVENMGTIGKPENLGAQINSEHDELCPVISADGNTLYFVRTGHPENLGDKKLQDIWFSRRMPDGSYGLAENMGEPLNNSGNNAITSITPDGQTAVLIGKYLPDGKMKNGVSIARRDDQGFSLPISCEIEDYYNDSKYSEYCLSANGKTLLLAIQRKDGYGSKDLFVCFLKEDGSWTAPLNLGRTVNTADSETSPFLAADEKTLYYSTAGFAGYGSRDMFLTRRLDDTWTNWSEPQNLGPSLNTSGFDAYYSIPASGEYAYFVSYENSIGLADIFRAKLPDEIRPLPVVLVRGRVFDAKTGQALKAGIVYESLSTGEEVGIANSNAQDGSYSIALPAGTDYGFQGKAKGYAPVSQRLDLRDVEEYREVIQDLALVPLESGAVVVMNNLFFDTGKSELRDISRNELRRLSQMMQEYPDMKVEIGGHTDDVGTDASNMILSKDRASAVREFLTDTGIEASRIVAKGYGESAPRFENNSDENRQRNRRVEFRVLEM